MQTGVIGEVTLVPTGVIGEVTLVPTGALRGNISANWSFER